MQLRRVRLRNIRSYESADFEFGPGTTLVAGDVGAGKTSLLYAIEMALFGFAEVDAANLIRHGAVHAEVTVGLEHEGHTYEVGRQFRRLNRRGKDTFEVERLAFSKDGAKTVYSTTELRQQVIDLFGFPDNPNPRTPSDLWRWAVYVPQERMREVLAQRPEERLETVRKALGVEKYRIAAENAKDVASEIRQTARIRHEETERLLHHENELADAGRELEALERALAETHRALEDGHARFAESERLRLAAESVRELAIGDLRELEGLTRESARDRSELLDRERRLQAIDTELAKPGPPPGSRDALIARRHELETRRAQLDAEREVLAREREALEGRLRELTQARAELAAATRRREGVEADLRSAGGELEACRAAGERARSEGPSKEPPAPTPRTLAEIDALLAVGREAARAAEAELIGARSELEEWTKLLAGGVCPRCHQEVRPAEFEPHRADAGRRRELAEAATAERGAVVGQLEEERRSRERYERARDRWQDSTKIREIAAAAVARAESRLRETEQNRDQALAAEQAAHVRAAGLADVPAAEVAWKTRSEALATRRRDLEATLEQLRRDEERAQAESAQRDALGRDRERLLRESDLLRTRLRDRESAAVRLETSRARLPELEQIWEARRKAESDARGALERAQLDQARQERDAEAARRRRADAERGVAERTRLLAEVRLLERKADWLGREFREALLLIEARILASARANFQRDFAKFFRTLLDDPTLEARVGESFTPSVLIKGEWTPAEALSGGERTSLALAFRLALGRVVRSMGELHLDTLILDEPTDGFSPEQVVRMADLLETLGLPQVILVSHESELSAVADHVMEARKVDGVSMLTNTRVPEESALAQGPETPDEPRRRRSRRTRDATLPAE